MNERNTLLYKNISLILFSNKAHSFLFVWEIDGETYTQRGDFFLSHIFSREPGDANACTLLQAVSSERSEMPLIGYVPRSNPDSLLCLNLTAWLSHGLLLVIHLFDLTAIMCCHLPVYKSQPDSLSKHTGSLGMNWKSISYVIYHKYFWLEVYVYAIVHDFFKTLMHANQHFCHQWYTGKFTFLRHFLWGAHWPIQC